MADPYIGEVRIFGFDYAPLGWVFCDGQLLPLAQYSSLFAVIGVIYGGNGTTNFGVPNLQGRIPIGYGQGQGLTPYPIAATGGNATLTLGLSQIPNHNHDMTATNNNAATNLPTDVYPSKHQDDSKGYMYKLDPTLDTQFASTAVANTGGNLGHENRQPYLPVNYCIATEGVFPVRP